MGMLAELTGGITQTGSLFGAPPVQPPTLDDLYNRVGADFTYTTLQRADIQDRIRRAQAHPGNSVATPVYGIRGAIGQGLRAIADRYFTPKPLSADNIPGYRRIGQ
jgi:hypothetical protein